MGEAAVGAVVKPSVTLLIGWIVTLLV